MRTWTCLISYFYCHRARRQYSHASSHKRRHPQTPNSLPCPLLLHHPYQQHSVSALRVERGQRLTQCPRHHRHCPLLSRGLTSIKPGTAWTRSIHQVSKHCVMFVCYCPRTSLPFASSVCVYLFSFVLLFSVSVQCLPFLSNSHFLSSAGPSTHDEIDALFEGLDDATDTEYAHSMSYFLRQTSRVVQRIDARASRVT